MLTWLRRIDSFQRAVFSDFDEGRFFLEPDATDAEIANAVWSGTRLVSVTLGARRVLPERVTVLCSPALLARFPGPVQEELRAFLEEEITGRASREGFVVRARKDGGPGVVLAAEPLGGGSEAHVVQVAPAWCNAAAKGTGLTPPLGGRTRLASAAPTTAGRDVRLAVHSAAAEVRCFRLSLLSPEPVEHPSRAVEAPADGALSDTDRLRLPPDLYPPSHRSWRLRDGDEEHVRTEGDVLVLGRDQASNDVALGWDDTVTRLAHLALLADAAGRAWVVDLASRNGTIRNGTRLLPFVPVRLGPADVLVIGETTLLCEHAGAVAS